MLITPIVAQVSDPAMDTLLARLFSQAPARAHAMAQARRKRGCKACRPAPITVDMPDGTLYTFKSLLGDGDKNTKLAKSNKAGKGFLTFGLSLAPARMSGYNVCPFASKGCSESCLYYAGHGSQHGVQRARIAKTRAFFKHTAAFLAMLHYDIARFERRAQRKGLRLAVRLNMLSDLPWERIDPTLFSAFPRVVFYDYTKRPGRVTPRNYRLTFSRSEDNDAIALAEYARGLNVAVVFESANLPRAWQGLRVFSGDKTDLRFLDRRGVVGLYAKGRARRDTSGFVVPTAVGLSLAGKRIA